MKTAHDNQEEFTDSERRDPSVGSRHRDHDDRGEVQPSSSAERPKGLGLGKLNVRFHERLERIKSEERVLIERGEVPVALRRGDDLTLTVADEITAYQINGRRYHTLKAMAHLPIMASLDPVAGEDGEQLEDELFRYLEESRAQIGGFLPEHVSPRAYATALRDLMRAADALSGDGLETLKTVQQHTTRLAAEDEVGQLIAALQDIRERLTGAQWHNLFFVVTGGNQARYKELSKNFFARLVRVDTSSKAAAVHRVIYSEDCDELEDARTLVVERRVSARLAERFFDSPIRLDEDALGNAGLAVIADVFSRDPTDPST